MSEKPLVSVVIATYNMAGYLPGAIQSVLDQTYPNIEILVVDDGSTDDTQAIIKPHLDNARITYVLQENKGQAAAKNCGIRKSRGDLVAFLDADDLWTPEKLDLQIPMFFGSEALGIVYSRVAYIDEHGTKGQILGEPLFRGRISGPLLVNNFIGFGTAVVRKECFDRLGGFKEELLMGIDYDLWLRFSTLYEFDYIDRPLLYYRVWSGQMSHNCRGRYQSGIAIMNAFLRDHPGVVDRSVENEAWAHTYLGFGQCLLKVEKSIGVALRYYIRALSYKPTYIPAWKAIVKAILRGQRI